MKAPPEGTPGRFRLWALAAVIAYLTIEALALGVLAVPRFPIALFVSDYLGLGYAGALGVLASLIVVSVGAEGLILSPMRGAKVLQSAPKVPAPRGIESSSINTLLRDTSQNFVEVFPLKTGVINVYGAISKEEGVEGYRYVVIEPELTPPERKQFDQLKELLIEEMDVDLRSIETREKAEAFLTNKVAQLAQTYGFNIPRPTMRKLQYYFARDFIHLGKIDPLMLDPLIEDISCDGGKIPIYVWHRDYESIPTNVSFDTDQELDTFVSKLAYVSGKHISLAAPMVDASLNDGSRLHLTYGKEITQKGSTFTIRKFRADPFTVVDLIKYNTLNPEVAAYLWYLVEKRLALLVAGGTASGKSVPGSEQVLVYRDGRKQLAQISTLYEEAARGGRTAREGVYDVARPSGWKTAAFGPDLKVGLFDVKSVIRHAAPKSIYRLKTRSGREVSTTGSHSVFTLRDGEVTAFPVSELSPGSFIAVPRVIPEPTEAPGAMDLVDALSPDDGGMYVENVVGHLKRAVDLVGVAETARRLNMSKTSVRLYLSRGFAALRVATFRRLLEITGEHADASALRIRPKTNRQLSVPASLKISKELMRLLGYWVSEGMYQDHGISLFQLSEEVRGDMITTARAVFGADL
ncbi:MAG: Flp pilus assembly complex ATPase component TadA, partial [Thaumarchaeota archaeon]|nr:Flp pilus assembly complex ATPase component TadA [Nitrososphaerota archaeon]